MIHLWLAVCLFTAHELAQKLLADRDRLIMTIVTDLPISTTHEYIHVYIKRKVELY